MPRIGIATVVSSRDGVALPTPTTGNATDNHKVTNTGKTKVYVRNTNGAATPRIVTFRFARTVDNQAVASRTKSIPAGETQVFGPFPVEDYGQELLIDVAHAELTLYAVE